MQVRLQSQEGELNTEVTQSIARYRAESEMTGAAEHIRHGAQFAHRLDSLLAKRNVIVRYHRHFIENRGEEQGSVAFYENLAAVDSLLDFIRDDQSNNDPVDVTMNQEFYLHYRTRHSGAPDKFSIQRIEDGWFISGLGGGRTPQSCMPILSRLLENEGIVFPSDLASRFERIWRYASEEGLMNEEVQQAFDQLSSWIEEINRTRPTEGRVWDSI